LVEQRIENPRVGGSIPPLGTKYKTSLALAGLFYLGSRGRMRSTDVVRPIAQQSATSAQARSPQGTNSPEAVCIIPPLGTIIALHVQNGSEQ
jgi:hypothetical protein